MSDNNDVRQADENKESDSDKSVKTEEEIWCDYRETMYNAWAEQQKNK